MARTDAGFTMIEMMIVVAMSAILLAVASPSFMSLVRTNRLDVAGGDLRSAVMLARSEAVKRAALTVVEPVSGNDWTSGVRVYVDADADPTNAYAAASDLLIRQFANFRNLTISGSPPARLAFDSRGQNVSLAATGAARLPTASTVALCIAPSRRDIEINRVGYVSYANASC
ncbi:MAG TPA: GspH/FimT family pseudopilin [Burkholderiaceae bacterium]|nr:GspH/FimT family pseudopilin [Burkholderiaceae bacterium]